MARSQGNVSFSHSVIIAVRRFRNSGCSARIAKFMTLENKVVLSTEIVVDIETDGDGHPKRMEEISQRLQDAVAQAFAGDSSINPVAGIAYDWLNDPDSNFGHCADCNRLVSDYEKPNQIRVLVDARVTDGKLLCDECAYYGREGFAGVSDGLSFGQ